MSKQHGLKQTNINETDSLDQQDPLNFTDAIHENRHNEFKIVVNNNENITFRNQKSTRQKMQQKDFPAQQIPEEDEFIFHDVNLHNTADRNKELIEQIGELKNSVYN